MSQFSDPLALIEPTNSWQLLTALLIGNKVPSKAWRKTSFRLKFFSRSLLSWPITNGLLNTLASSPLLDEILSAQPNLPCKLHRPYLATNMKQIDRLFALRDHYNLIIQRMPLRMRLDHLGRQPFTLSSAQDKNDEQICLQLAAIDKLNKEGEATLLLRNAKGIILAEITFTLMNYLHKPTLFIGGLQGANCGVPHTEIQSTTKACHGLFPKRLVLEGILQLAQQLEISQVVAVGNSTHIYQNWRYHRKKRELLHADYDQFWVSMGGKLLSSGYFLLPKHLARKPMEAIASKKRAEYRRRYQLLDELQRGIDAHFPQHLI